jgi:hypothetical protein
MTEREQFEAIMAFNNRATIAQPVPAINNFCPRCGKRNAADLIYTCTPPRN